jgi:hypothetical protein
MSNVQCPSGAGVWRQHGINIQYPMSNIQVVRVFVVSTFVNCQRLHGPIQAFKTQAIVLTPDTRPTWILDIGHCRRTLNIPEKTT